LSNRNRKMFCWTNRQSWLTKKIANNFGGVLTPKTPPPSYGLAENCSLLVSRMSSLLVCQCSVFCGEMRREYDAWMQAQHAACRRDVRGNTAIKQIHIDYERCVNATVLTLPLYTVSGSILLPPDLNYYYTIPMNTFVRQTARGQTMQTINIIKKLSCRRETARRFVSLNISQSHSRSFEMTLLSRACVSLY